MIGWVRRAHLVPRLRGPAIGALALALAPVVVACGPSVRTFSATFPAVGDPGEVVRPAQPVDVLDFTGIVSGLRVREEAGPGFAPGVVVEGSVLHVSWVGGACESRVRLVLGIGDDGRYRVAVRPEPSLGGLLGCPAVGIFRAVDIELTIPLEQRQVFPLTD